MLSSRHIRGKWGAVEKTSVSDMWLLSEVSEKGPGQDIPSILSC
jgi:hypothetical protein